ncbi:hypothetical protein RFI_27307 [Reticulomyxa filosa]|uniref:Plastocyanin-like domain-containing protein n=1 Tax=Reticulomyxa filosa TaxID=46433 RepID=X6MAK4_RETFI|nr:hypothetical protein RFI_27307 [Reticulomyxa filosa]|eukprot:ETO10070.1 hypothetical protein RFI_27307 [Reticulomyxa filosa]
MLLLLIICAFHILESGAQQCLDNPRELVWIQEAPGVFNATLTLDVFKKNINTATSFTTRAINGDIPGPTIRMTRGNTYKILYKNNLGPESRFNPTTHGSHMDPNTTNLHVHGINYFIKTIIKKKKNKKKNSKKLHV